MERVIADAGRRGREDRCQAGAIESLRDLGVRESCKLCQSGEDIYAASWLLSGGVGCGAVGCSDDQGDAIGVFIVRVLGPESVISEMEAVIAPKDDDCGIPELEAVECVEDEAGLSVHVTDAGVVSMDQLAGLICGGMTMFGDR